MAAKSIECLRFKGRLLARIDLVPNQVPFAWGKSVLEIYCGEAREL